MDKNISDQQIESSIENILIEYDQNIEVYKEFEIYMKDLLHEIFNNTNIKIKQIKLRIKGKDNITEKIIRKAKDYKNPKLYKSISSITDIIGARIVVYLKDDIDNVAAVIKQEFKEDKKNSIDKRNHQVDCFGYLSYHQVIELDKNRLKEKNKFKKIKFEVQIRTGLQDVWADIEHKLGYKAKSSMTYENKRMLTRLAATLEIIDKGFVEVHEKKDEFLTHTDLFNLISKNEIIKNIDSLISRKMYHINIQHKDTWSFDQILKNLKYLNITTIDDSILELTKYKKKLILFIDQIFDKAIPIEYTNGVSLIYLCLLLGIERFTESDFISYLKNTEMRYGTDAQYFYKIINNCYNRMLLIDKYNLQEKV